MTTGMPYKEAIDLLNAGHSLSVTCPDGVERTVYGCNEATGDLLVAGWRGDVWMDCSDGTIRAEFE